MRRKQREKPRQLQNKVRPRDSGFIEGYSVLHAIGLVLNLLIEQIALRRSRGLGAYCGGLGRSQAFQLSLRLAVTLEDAAAFELEQGVFQLIEVGLPPEHGALNDHWRGEAFKLA